MNVHQWDIVKVRVNPGDKDEHPAVVLSRENGVMMSVGAC